ncbi:MAG: hypothetical protein ACFB0C_12730 [Leptolyngbyaceae cyanobacterium]
MIDPNNVPPIEEAEWLARYVMQSSHFRKSDFTVKSNLFIPHPYQELSVTRHRDATKGEIWAIGQDVASQQQRTLYGRADIRARDCAVDSLRVTAKPFPNNPNHADVEGWPSEKQAQKAIALELAALASPLKIPPVSPAQSE